MGSVRTVRTLTLGPGMKIPGQDASGRAELHSTMARIDDALADASSADVPSARSEPPTSSGSNGKESQSSSRVVPVLHVTETQQEISRQVIEESLRTGMHPERRARLKALQDSQSQCEGGLPRLAPPPLDPLDPLIQSLTTQEALTMLTHSIRDFLQALEEALRPMMSAVRTATEAMNRVRPTSKVPFWADAPQNRRRRG